MECAYDVVDPVFKEVNTDTCHVELTYQGR